MTVLPSGTRLSFPAIAKRGFKRSLLGYSRQSVEEEIATRDARLARLEREATNLAERVLDRERRLQAAIRKLGEDDSAEVRGAITSLGRRLEDIHAQARSQATKIRMRALKDAVAIADRVGELSRVRELLESAGVELPDDALDGAEEIEEPREPLAETDPGQEALFDGKVEVEIGPLADFSQLSAFEDAANAIGAAGEIEVTKFSGGRATLSVALDQPIDLLRELEERAALEFKVRSTKQDRVVLDVDEDETAAA
jgi:hypothetical protein